MKLTVAIIYCDKDWKYVPELVEDVRKKVAMRHEIVLVDNTTEGTPIEADKYFWMGGNKYATQGRKKAVELAAGDYVWFVDADDEIYPLGDPCCNDDMVIYGYEVAGEDGVSSALSKEEFSVSAMWLMNRSTFNYLGQTLWNKLIRTDILREVEKSVPDDWLSVAGEDILLYAACYCRCRSIRFKTEVIYRFRADRSASANLSMTYGMFRHVLEGCSETRELMKKLVGKNLKSIGLDDDHEQDIDYYLGRIDRAVNDNEAGKMMGCLLDYFGEDRVVFVLKKKYKDTAALWNYLPEQLVEEEKEQ